MFWGSWRVTEVLQGWKEPIPFPPQVQECRGDKLSLCWVLTASLDWEEAEQGETPNISARLEGGTCTIFHPPLTACKDYGDT